MRCGEVYLKSTRKCTRSQLAESPFPLKNYRTNTAARTRHSAVRVEPTTAVGQGNFRLSRQGNIMLKRIAFFVYGVTGHLLFLATYAWLAAFVGNLVVPHSIDGPSTASWPQAAAIDLGLIVLFGLQHSIMARPGFKQVWTKVVPQSIERSTYVFIACAMTMLLMWQWRPIGLVIWDVKAPAGRWLLHGLFVTGWLMVPAVSLMISHCDLFGTRQVWLYLRGREYTPLAFRTPMLYRRMRHPMYVGWAIAFWATPTMTLGHLLFATGMTAYMLVAVVFEERDLLEAFGRQYAEYQRRVPMFLPRLGTRQPEANLDCLRNKDRGPGSLVTAMRPCEANAGSETEWM